MIAERRRKPSEFPPIIMPNGAEIRIDTLPQAKSMMIIQERSSVGQTFTVEDLQSCIDTNGNSPDLAEKTDLLFRQLKGKAVQANMSIRQTKGKKGEFMLVNLEEESAKSKTPKRAKKEFKKPEEEKDIVEEEESSPKGETTLNGGIFRTPEQKIEEKKRFFTDFTRHAASAIAGKGIESLSHDPHDIIKAIPNGNRMLKVLSQPKEELANELINGFEETIRKMHGKFSHKPERIEFSPKESEIFDLLKTIKEQKPDFQIKNVPMELRKHLNI